MLHLGHGIVYEVLRLGYDKVRKIEEKVFVEKCHIQDMAQARKLPRPSHGIATKFRPKQH